MFTYDVPLRWLDLDAQGHVNNGKLVDVLQEARVAFTLAGPIAHLLGNGIIVVGHRVEYLRAVDFAASVLRVELQVGKVTPARFTLGYEVFADAVLVARAQTVCCLFDFEAQRPHRLEAEDRAFLSSLSTEVVELPDLGSWSVGERAHVTPLNVRWSDLDSYGHVNNVRFYDYVGEARVRLMAGLLPGPSIRGNGEGPEHTWLVARQDLSYLGQLAFTLEVRDASPDGGSGGPGEVHGVGVVNGAMHHAVGAPHPDATLTVSTTHGALVAAITSGRLDQLAEDAATTIDGDVSVLERLSDRLDTFELFFPIVTP